MLKLKNYLENLPAQIYQNETGNILVYDLWASKYPLIS